MNVMRELIDKPVFDCDGRPMGRVDGLELTYEAGQPPRLTTILIGPAALAHRLHPRLGRWLESVERSVGLPPDRPTRIDITDVADVTEKVMLRLSIRDTAANAVEERISRWLVRLPGSR
jgi:hypothetical protein